MKRKKGKKKEEKNKSQEIGAWHEFNANTALKSSSLDKCLKLSNYARASIANNDFEKANGFYAEARQIYVKLGYNEKKDAYSELAELYNRLKQV